MIASGEIRRRSRGFLLPVALILLAETIGRIVELNSLTVAIPSSVAAAFWAALQDGSIVSATTQTLLSVAIGVTIGTVIGLLLGIMLGLVRQLDRVFALTIELIRPIPTVALIPLVILISGLGYVTEISIIAFGTLWPVFILSRAAIHDVEPRLFEVAQALGLSWMQRVLMIVIPSIAPRIFLAFRLAVGFALIIAVTVEITTNPLGLGNSMTLAQNALNPALALALLVWIGLVGWVLGWVLHGVERLIFFTP